MNTNRHDHQKLYTRGLGLYHNLSVSSFYKGSEEKNVDRRKQIDRRKHIRYSVKEKVFVNLRSETGQEFREHLIKFYHPFRL